MHRYGRLDQMAGVVGPRHTRRRRRSADPVVEVGPKPAAAAPAPGTTGVEPDPRRSRQADDRHGAAAGGRCSGVLSPGAATAWLGILWNPDNPALHKYGKPWGRAE